MTQLVNLCLPLLQKVAMNRKRGIAGINMKRLLFIFCFAFSLGISGTTRAQYAFWNFDEQGNEIIIPPQCDGRFDETDSGATMPTPEEMLKAGENLLINRDPVMRSGAAFCFVAAALQGNVDAQLRLAQLYNKGFILPQDDLSAYRWAFIASLSGNKEAERLALVLERFMTTEDILLATQSAQEFRPLIQSKYQQELETQNAILEEKKSELDALVAENDAALGIKVPSLDVQDEVEEKMDLINSERDGIVPGGVRGDIFTEADRLK